MATTMEMQTKSARKKIGTQMRIRRNRNAPSISFHVISLYFFSVLFSACMFVINSFFATSKSRCGNKQLFTRPTKKGDRKGNVGFELGIRFVCECEAQHTNGKAHNARSDQTIKEDREN